MVKADELMNLIFKVVTNLFIKGTLSTAVIRGGHSSSAIDENTYEIEFTFLKNTPVESIKIESNFILIVRGQYSIVSQKKI